MAETRITKIQVRQGNFADLPLLDPAEIGYATDVHRLFIGNSVVSVGTGDGTRTLFSVPADLSTVTTSIAVFVDGSQINASDFTISGTSLTFATAPALGEVITVKYNAEVNVKSFSSTVPVSTSLAASGNLQATGFSTDVTTSNVVFLDYTLKNANGLRIGQLRFAYNDTTQTTTIDDNYTEVGTVDVEFSVDTSIVGTMRLMYTDSDNLLSTFKYTYQLWNSN